VIDISLHRKGDNVWPPYIFGDPILVRISAKMKISLLVEETKGFGYYGGN
jgi:hypothetical protein